MSSYSCKNFQDEISNISKLYHVVQKSFHLNKYNIVRVRVCDGDNLGTVSNGECSTSVEYSTTLKNFVQIQNKLKYVRFFFSA